MAHARFVGARNFDSFLDSKGRGRKALPRTHGHLFSGLKAS